MYDMMLLYFLLNITQERIAVSEQQNELQSEQIARLKEEAATSTTSQAAETRQGRSYSLPMYRTCNLEK